MFQPSSLLVFRFLKSKSSRALNVMGRMLLALSRHALEASFKASISGPSGRSWVNEKAQMTRAIRYAENQGETWKVQ